jgi:hypothetical protein
MNPSLINHKHLGAWIVGVAAINHLYNMVADNDHFLQGLASIVSIIGVGVGVYFTVRNRRK